jgi:hypothetical protein
MYGTKEPEDAQDILTKKFRQYNTYVKLDIERNIVKENK